ncbi:hypothetical protein [Flavobacterium sp.]|uniref:hypothetical protein n=1 Tax=Flavobacterium sp. TaxID=239 RepID=UPI002631BD81|nr:hypothetical protein [Flavobacterium sp.]
MWQKIDLGAFCRFSLQVAFYRQAFYGRVSASSGRISRLQNATASSSASFSLQPAAQNRYHFTYYIKVLAVRFESIFKQKRVGESIIFFFNYFCAKSKATYAKEFSNSRITRKS